MEFQFVLIVRHYIGHITFIFPTVNNCLAWGTTICLFSYTGLSGRPGRILKPDSKRLYTSIPVVGLEPADSGIKKYHLTTRPSPGYAN